MENGRTIKSSMVSAFILLVNVYRFDPRLLKWKGDFEKLMLSEFDIRRLYSIFRQVDVDGSGTIDILELLMYFDIESTKFSRQVFSVMDEDTSGEIDFREFVISCWNYATLGDEALILFGFDLYDRDCSNVLEAAEIAKMLNDLYGKNFEKNKRAIKLHHDIENGQHQTFTPADFREFAKNHPALFFPAFEMQRLIQRKVLGKMFWQRHAEKRLLASSDGIVRIRDLIGFRTKVNDPPSQLRQLHPIFQNHGHPSPYSYAAAGGGGGGADGPVSAPPTPTHGNGNGNGTDSSIHLKESTNSTSHVVSEFDEPVKQFLQHQSQLESVLEITNVRGHRAAKMKHARDSKPVELLSPAEKEQKKREKLDNLIQRCSDPPVELTSNWVHSQDRIQTRQLPTWRSETHLVENKVKEKDSSPSHGHHHSHGHHNHTHHHTEQPPVEDIPPPKKETDTKWSSLLQLQSIVITKPKKEKKRRSTFSFFGNPSRIAPIDTTLMDHHAHPIADAVINGQVGGGVPSTPVKKKDKKRRYSV